MKKRLLSALLALALVFVLLPTTALAGVTTGSDYDISINGKKYVLVIVKLAILRVVLQPLNRAVLILSSLKALIQ